MDERSHGLNSPEPEPSLPGGLAHAGWLRALARELVADEHLAEDLAQDTLVAALEHAPGGAASRSWLATVLRNFLRQVARRDGHRRVREFAAARAESGPPADQVVADLEAHRRLLEAVGALDEPYRQVIVMRFLRGLAPREIGRELGVPPAAVSNRITVGLRHLRRRLDRDSGDRPSWLALVAPLVLRSDPPLAPLGVLAVNSKIVAAASLAVAGTVAWFLWKPSEPTRAAPDDVDSAAPLAQPSAGTPPDAGSSPEATQRLSVDAPQRPESSPSAPSTSVSATFAVRGRVFDASGAARPGVRVALEGDAEHATTSGTGGWFELSSASAAAEIRSADPSWIDVCAGVFSAESSVAPVLVVAPSIAIEGRVADAAGDDLAHARVSVVAPSGFDTRFEQSLESARQLEWRSDSDSRGGFRIERAPAIDGARLRVVLDGYEPHDEPAPTFDAYGLEIVLRRPAKPASGAVDGIVVDTLRRPIEGARVALGLASVLTDESGEFHIDLRRAATSDALRAVKPGYRPAVLERPYAERPSDGGWPERVEVVLAEGTLSISGRVVRPDGSALANARVSLAEATPFGLIGMLPASLEALAGGAPVPPEAVESSKRLPEEDGDRTWTFRNRPPPQSTAIWSFVRTREDGSFEIEGLCDRAYRLRVLDEATLVQLTSDPIDAGARDVRIEVPAPELWPVLSGRVLDPDGRGVPRVGLTPTVEAHGARSRVWGGSVSMRLVQPRETVLTDEQGRFELRDVPKVGLRLEIEGGPVVPSEISLEGFADPTRVEIPVDVRCDLEIVLAEPFDRADSVRAFDADGESIDLLRIRNRSVNASTDLPLVEGRSGVVSVSSRARTLVLTKDSAEVARIAVKPSASEATVVRW